MDRMKTMVHIYNLFYKLVMIIHEIPIFKKYHDTFQSDNFHFLTDNI